MTTQDRAIREVRRWAEVVQVVGETFRRPLHYALAFSSPVWAAAAVAADRAPVIVMCLGFAVLSAVIGLAGVFR